MTHPPEDLRIISLIPSATEIVHVLGGLDYLVGRSHECDYPPEVRDRPICTAPNLDPTQSSAAIHEQLESLLQKALSIYSIDLEQIARLKPTHILTQAQCEVCAVSFEQVAAAVSQLEECSPMLISLQPRTIEEVWSDIQHVGERLGLSSDSAMATLSGQLSQLQKQAIAPQKTVVCIEWTDPLMAAGNWVPELVALAGGKELLGNPGQHSGWLTWEQLQSADPDVLIVMPCGFELVATHQAVKTLALHERWHTLKAVRDQQVFLTDGNQYFNRPGPRLVESLAILVEILNGDMGDRKTDYGTGWVKWNGDSTPS